MKKIIYLSILTALSLVSCKKFLDQQPDDRTELNSAVKVAEVLASAYPHGNYIPFTEAMSDNADDKNTTSRDNKNSLPWQYKDQEVNGDEIDTPPFYWNECYRAISAANAALETIANASNPQEYSASKGEALVARAYAHFMLVTLFSKSYNPATASSDPGIPYVTKLEKSVDSKYERGTIAFVYEQIEKDLIEGIPLIQDNTYKVPKYHFTTVAAHAFAARFYLFKRDYQKVIDHSELTFPGSSIVNSLREWNTTYTNSTYYVLQAQYTNSIEPANLLLAEANTVWGRSYAGYNYGLNTNLLFSVMGSANPLGYALVMQSNIYGSGPEVYNIPKFVEHFVKESISANFGDPYNMIPLLTAEEVLFNRAEAFARLGNNAAALININAYLSKRIEAYSPVSDVLTQEMVTDYYEGQSVTDAVISTILNFKRGEYMHEGLRWFDVVRLKIPIVHKSFDNKVTITLGPDDPRRVIQIPKESITLGLAPNPR